MRKYYFKSLKIKTTELCRTGQYPQQLRKLRQTDHKFNACLDYRLSSTPHWALFSRCLYHLCHHAMYPRLLVLLSTWVRTSFIDVFNNSHPSWMWCCMPRFQIRDVETAVCEFETNVNYIERSLLKNKCINNKSITILIGMRGDCLFL